MLDDNHPTSKLMYTIGTKSVAYFGRTRREISPGSKFYVATEIVTIKYLQTYSIGII